MTSELMQDTPDSDSLFLSAIRARCRLTSPALLKFWLWLFIDFFFKWKKAEKWQKKQNLEIVKYAK